MYIFSLLVLAMMVKLFIACFVHATFGNKEVYLCQQSAKHVYMFIHIVLLCVMYTISAQYMSLVYNIHVHLYFSMT